MGGIGLRRELPGRKASLRVHQRALPRPLWRPSHRGHLQHARCHHCGSRHQCGPVQCSGLSSVGKRPRHPPQRRLPYSKRAASTFSFRPGYEAYAMGSDSGWGGSPITDNPNYGQGAWGSPPPGATDIDTLGGAGHPSGGGGITVQQNRRSASPSNPTPGRGSPNRRRWGRWNRRRRWWRRIRPRWRWQQHQYWPWGRG